MAELFQCTRCRAPFVAEDEKLIARRGGLCAECTRVNFLTSIGLSPDFLKHYRSIQE